MSGICIKGMEMPTSHPICVVIDATGQARRYDLNNDKYADNKLFEAVPVPPHGDLIDRDALPWENQGLMLTDPDEWGLKAWDIEHAPTIIPADKEGE